MNTYCSGICTKWYLYSRILLTVEKTEISGSDIPAFRYAQLFTINEASPIVVPVLPIPALQ